MQLDPRGQIDMMILAVLGDGEWIYGRALIQELRDRSDGEVDLPEGTAYPALHRLMAAGLLDRRDEYVAHRQRRYYRLNDRGRYYLADRQQWWQRMTAVVHKVMFGPTTERTSDSRATAATDIGGIALGAVSRAR